MWPSHRGATALEMVALEETGQDFNPGILIPPCLPASSSPELRLLNKDSKGDCEGEEMPRVSEADFPSSSKEESLG